MVTKSTCVLPNTKNYSTIQMTIQLFPVVQVKSYTIGESQEAVRLSNIGLLFISMQSHAETNLWGFQHGRYTRGAKYRRREYDGVVIQDVPHKT